MTEGFVVVLFPRYICDPKKLCSKPSNFCFLRGKLSYNLVSYNLSLPWNNFEIKEHKVLERATLS